MKSSHYELKKIYHGILQNDPDYPAWQDFEEKEYSTSCMTYFYRCEKPIAWSERNQYRYNPLPKKWEPKGGWYYHAVEISSELIDEDREKLQAYATKLSWLREQGGYEFKEGAENYSMYHSGQDGIQPHIDEDCPDTDTIFMSKEQAEKWLEMIKKGEV